METEQPALTQTANEAKFCMCDSGVARCQSQNQCYFWRMSSMFETIARASEHGSCQSNLCHSWGYGMLQKSKDSLKACFENVNISQSHLATKWKNATIVKELELIRAASSLEFWWCIFCLSWVNNLLIWKKRSADNIKSMKNYPACKELWKKVNRKSHMNHDMWFPTKWGFDKWRLRRACAASF